MAEKGWERSTSRYSDPAPLSFLKPQDCLHPKMVGRKTSAFKPAPLHPHHRAEVGSPEVKG